jgi:nucleoside-diphosphate-sugar epimerase
MGKTLVVGSSGQIGTELVEALKEIKGEENVIASDIKPPQVQQSGIFETLNILDKENLLSIIKKHQVTEVYLLAALLSATAEKNPIFAWDLNMNGLFNVLNLAKEGIIKKIFWPSSIAVFGPNTPKINTPQFTVTDPTTVYGISKLSGERWCEYYFNKYNVDVRSIRYPGLIGYNSLPGGGTTDYAVDIFYKALKEKSYDCFLKADATLPMMYMPDAIRATIELMEAESNKITIRSSYNLSSLSFSPLELVNEIKKIIPEFKATYTPDFRQNIAASWPQSIDDSCARKDWGWKEKYNLEKMTIDIIKNLKQKM